MKLVQFTVEELDDLIYAAREATIRFKRARTELKRENPNYLHWDLEYLHEKICFFADLEGKLILRKDQLT